MSRSSKSEQSLFLAALEIEKAEDRAHFLDVECGDDRELRAEVQALLEASEKSGDLLDVGVAAMEPTVARDQQEQPGCSIGPYKLRER